MNDGTMISGGDMTQKSGRVSFKTYGLLFLVVSLMGLIGYKVWDANKPLPAKNYSVDETRLLIMPNLVLVLPPVQSQTVIGVGTLPPALTPFIIAGSGAITTHAVVYNDSKSGFLISYTLAGTTVQDFVTRVAALPGWQRLFAGGSLTFGAVEVQNTAYSVRALVQNMENTLSVEVQVITAQ